MVGWVTNNFSRCAGGFAGAPPRQITQRSDIRRIIPSDYACNDFEFISARDGGSLCWRSVFFQDIPSWLWR